MSHPSISIITATYNSAATLTDTLESLARQEIPNLDVIVQDGGSTDDTLQIAERYPFVSIVSEPDGGLYNAMNRGIARACGDIIGILNSDDFYPTADVLHSVRAVFATNSKIMAVYGDLKYVDHRNTTKVIREWKAKPYQRKRWKRGWMPPHPTFFVRREVYEKYGDFNEDFQLAADYEFMLRVCFCNNLKVSYIPKTLVHMRAGGVSNASLANRLRGNDEDRRAWEINGSRAPRGLQFFKPVRKIKQWFRR